MVEDFNTQNKYNYHVRFDVYYHWFDIYLCGLVIILINLTINLVDAENRDTWYVRCLVPSLEARRAVCQDVVRNIAGNTKV